MASSQLHSIRIGSASRPRAASSCSRRVARPPTASGSSVISVGTTRPSSRRRRTSAPAKIPPSPRRTSPSVPTRTWLRTCSAKAAASARSHAGLPPATAGTEHGGVSTIGGGRCSSPSSGSGSGSRRAGDGPGSSGRSRSRSGDTSSFGRGRLVAWDPRGGGVAGRVLEAARGLGCLRVSAKLRLRLLAPRRWRGRVPCVAASVALAVVVEWAAGGGVLVTPILRPLSTSVSHPRGRSV